MRPGSLVVCWSFLLISASLCSHATVDRNLEVEKLLSRLNKPPVKSIIVPDGDIIDCVNIYDQPAFDHPLLQNHTILTGPSSYPTGMNENEEEGEVAQDWHAYGSCPDGTVPILRSRGEDVLRAPSIEDYVKKSSDTVIPGSIHPEGINSINEYALAISENGFYQGGCGMFGVWSPVVEGRHEHSSGQMWVVGRSTTAEALEAGFHVHPRLYGDNRSRFFIHWTQDSYMTSGCYNLRCPGFIHTSKKIALGGVLTPVSKYGGRDYYINLKMWKERNTSIYWVKYGDEVVGYWPSSLFIRLSFGATNVNFGGEVINDNNGVHTATQMGSGHFPEEGYRKAAYIGRLEIINGDFELKPYKDYELKMKNSLCYAIKSGFMNGLLNHIYYGGPGRSRHCT